MRALVGRDLEVGRLRELVESAARGSGGALVLRGTAGVGKTALLAEASHGALALGLRVLWVSGVQTEMQLPFSGLYGLLRPLLSRIDALPAPQRNALAIAFGRAEGPASDLFLISLAALELLSEQAAERPLLVIVDDAQWLDPPSATAVAFLARRVAWEPIGVLLAVREDVAGERAPAGGPGQAGALDGLESVLQVPGLDATSAAAVLDTAAPRLAPAARARVLETARGNPLALLELPVALGREQAALPAGLPPPLTPRLEAIFAGRLDELPNATHTLLLAAALESGDDPAVPVAASEVVLQRPVGPADLEPAVASHLVAPGIGGVRFTHPLVRSAVYQRSSEADRRRLHAALVTACRDPDCRVWHRAGACAGVDDDCAAQLEAVAQRHAARGAGTAAIVALERAAELSADAARQAALLLQAARLAYGFGRLDVAQHLLGQLDPQALGPHQRRTLAYLSSQIAVRAAEDNAGLAETAQAAAELSRAGDSEQAVEALVSIALSCWFLRPEQRIRDLVLAAAEELPLSDDDPARLFIGALTDPVARGHQTLERLGRLRPDSVGDGPGAYLVGYAALAAWAPDVSLPFLAAGIAGLRREGRLGLLTQALVGQAWAGMHLSTAGVALPAAREAAQLAPDTRNPLWGACANLAEAVVLADRGDGARAEQLATSAEAVFLDKRTPYMLALVQHARGRAALAQASYDDAYNQLRRLFDVRDVAYHPFVRVFAVSEFAEAAAQVGRESDARTAVADLQVLAERSPGPQLVAGLACARAMLASGEDLEREVTAALGCDLHAWPSLRARLLLRYGTRLRRERRVSESRGPLRAARDTFDALGHRPWAERARQELRAAGETSQAAVRVQADLLTAQELQIAQLASEGLSNREIGRRLFLSHRTVQYHLHRTFPKLGISTRAQLSTALAVTA